MNNEKKIAIGKRIETIRKQMKMNKEEFAKFSGLTGQQVGTIEHGKTGLSIDKLINICERANISSDYILFGKDNINIESILNDLLKIYNEEELYIAITTIKSLIDNVKQITKL